MIHATGRKPRAQICWIKVNSSQYYNEFKEIFWMEQNDTLHEMRSGKAVVSLGMWLLRDDCPLSTRWMMIAAYDWPLFIWYLALVVNWWSLLNDWMTHLACHSFCMNFLCRPRCESTSAKCRAKYGTRNSAGLLIAGSISHHTASILLSSDHVDF